MNEHIPRKGLEEVSEHGLWHSNAVLTAMPKSDAGTKESCSQGYFLGLCKVCASEALQTPEKAV